jgi:potassium/hydrogen antiporter
MTNYVILFLCILIILAYVFDLTSRYSRIPGVLFLIFLGIFIQLTVKTTGFAIPNMRSILPVLGTLGLILIVLEASLDLKLERKKVKHIGRSITTSIILFALFVVAFSFFLVYVFKMPLMMAILNSIPLGVISSAVAIPSTVNLNNEQKEFVVYESSFSDIIGILVFDFMLIYSDSIGIGILNFTIGGIATVIVGFIVTAVLAALLYKIKYHINYVIILTFVIMTYSLAKLVHLPALMLILVFGLVLSNIRFFENDFMRVYVDFDKFRNDVDSFKRILAELTFIIRSFFFIMFGFYARLEGFMKLSNLLTASIIVILIFLFRYLWFRFILRLPALPLVFFSPRGLITILLFLSIPEGLKSTFISEEVIILVILATIFILAGGNIAYRKDSKRPDNEAISIIQ